VWWLDDRTKQLMEATTNLRNGQDLTIEFKGGAPIQITQEQVSHRELCSVTHVYFYIFITDILAELSFLEGCRLTLRSAS